MEKRQHPLLFNPFAFHNPIISLPSKGALLVAFIYLMLPARHKQMQAVV